MQCIFGNCQTAFLPSLGIKPESGCMMDLRFGEENELQKVILCPKHSHLSEKNIKQCFVKKKDRELPDALGDSTGGESEESDSDAEVSESESV